MKVPFIHSQHPIRKHGGHLRSTLIAGILSLPALAMAATDAASQPQVAKAEAPNIIIILTDDMGFTDLGIAGSEIATPNLDKLARQGALMTQFYNTARCCPSRASLLTGLYPHQAGIGHLIWETPHDGYGDRLRADSVTLAEVLGDNGYRTYMTGKWHMAPRSYNPETDSQHWPTGRGFDKFYGTIAGSGSFYDPMTLSRQTTRITPDNDPEYAVEEFYYTDAITDNALIYLREHLHDHADRPFFLYLAYTAPHWPLHAPERSIEPYRGRYAGGFEAIHAERVERLKATGIMPELGTIAEPVGRWEAVGDKVAEAALMEAYAAMITHMDAGIGQMVELLTVTGNLHNTLILYLHDNGPCAEDWFSDPVPLPHAPQPMAEDELQTRALPPMQTRDGREVRFGDGVIAGPADTYTGYKEAWANVSNAPFRWYKHYVHEGGISTPLIVHWPAAMPQPQQNSQLPRLIREPAHLIDIMATCLEAAGVDYPSQRNGIEILPTAGQSLLPLLTGNGPFSRPEPLFWEHESNRAVRDGKWKIVALENQPWELYDMDVDRAEMHNLAALYPQIVARMAFQWDQWAAANRVLPLGGWRDQIRSRSTTEHPQAVTVSQGKRMDAASSPNVAGAGVRMQTVVTSGPLEGVILAHGSRVNGYALYVENNELVFAVRRNRDLYRLHSGPLPQAPFAVEAVLQFDGIARLHVDDQIHTSKYWGPLILNPSAGITAGNDPHSVSRYQNKVPFTGKFSPVRVEALRHQSQQ